MSDSGYLTKRDKQELVEASWCKNCRRRNTCKNKEAVAFEENMVERVTRHLDVTAKCARYIKDNAVKVNSFASVWDFKTSLRGEMTDGRY